MYHAGELSSRVLMEILAKKKVRIPEAATRKELVALVEAAGGVTNSFKGGK